VIEHQLKIINEKLDRILAILQTPKGFVVNVKGESNMPGIHAATNVDFQILENGTAVFTATPVDANGNTVTLPPGTPSLTFTDAAGVFKFSVDPADTGFGLIQDGVGTAITTGDQVSCSTTLPGAAAPIVGNVSQLLDVVAGGPVGFTVAVSAPGTPASKPVVKMSQG